MSQVRPRRGTTTRVRAVVVPATAAISRPCRVPSGLGLALHQIGVAAGPTIASEGLLSPAATEAWPWLSIDDYFGLWEAIARRSGDELVGARLGAAAARQVLLEPVFLVCLGSRDLGEALERLGRFKRTLCPERLELDRLPGEAVVRYEWPTAPRSPPAVLVEAELSFLLHLVQEATRDAAPRVKVELTRPAGDALAWRRQLRADVRFDVGVGTLRFPASALATPFATSSPSLVAALEPTLEVERSRREASDLVARVQHALEPRIATGAVAVTDVARALAMSARSLQRHLRDAGTSFAVELQNARRARAVFLVRKSDLSLAEIAFLIGFDTASSFSRAFVRWTGDTPGVFRRGAPG